MRSTTVSIAEGKKDFSRLIHDAVEKKENIIITRRGKPVAVIVSYREYQCNARIEGYRNILKAREAFLKTSVTADDAYRESRAQLEEKQ